jgi:ATP-dependent Clp protease ATP-binding subunit ClpA
MAMSTSRLAQQALDPTLRSVESQEFQAALKSKVVGQEEGVRALVDLYQVFCAGMSSTGRPVGNLLFLGPTGSGKTRIVEAAAEILFGDPRAVIKVDCAEFQHSHEIAKLIGSPPGYLGHRETHPLITQEALAQYHKEDLKLSFLLFDEIEKASDALWQLLLGILDKATLTLGDNRRVDLSQTMIFLTSNLGGGEITELMTGGMGFVQPKDKAEDQLDHKVERTAQEAAKKKFSPEFMNRLDKVVVFHPLRQEQLEQILEIELGMVQQRVLDTGRGQFLFRVTPAARGFLLQEGTDIKYGARHLKRAIEKYVVYPLANLLATEQIQFGDMLVVGWDERAQEISFHREGQGAVIPSPRRAARGAAAQMAKATGGKVIEAPTQVIVREAKAPAALPTGAPPPVASGRKKVDPQ